MGTMTAKYKTNERHSSARVAKVPPSVMLSLAEKIDHLRASGEKVIDLSLGQPDVPAPPHVSEAMQHSLANPVISYSSSAGSEELRSLIAQDLSRRAAAEAKPSDVIITAGSKHALFISLLSILDPGDEVVVFEPYFPPYAEILALIGGAIRSVPILDSERGLKPDIQSFLGAIGKNTKAVILNYPNNPAGWTLERSEIKEIVDYCSQRRVYILSDEIYDHIVFDGMTHFPAWMFSGDSEFIISLGSFSKTYSMVPYRLGFLVAKKKIREDILKAQRATVTMVSPYVQSAGCAALKGPQDFVRSRLKKYEERRNRCCEILCNAGLRCHKPRGAFYLFFELPDQKFRNHAFEFASHLLDRYRVAVLPGGIFGERWKDYIRLSIATEDSALYQGLNYILEFSKDWSLI
jgi:aspartate aminotransferase